MIAQKGGEWRTSVGKGTAQVAGAADLRAAAAEAVPLARCTNAGVFRDPIDQGVDCAFRPPDIHYTGVDSSIFAQAK